MTDTPLPFEEEVEKILERVQLYAKDSPMKVSSIDNIDRAEAKAALIAAHQAEIRRVIGEYTPFTSTTADIWAAVRSQNILRTAQYERAGIEPDKDRDE